MNPTLVSTPTKCKLCNHVFKSNLMRDAAILGSDPQAKLQQVAAMTRPLIKHLQEKHPEAIQHAQMAGGEFAGYLTITGAFEIDPATYDKIGADFTRWNVHRLTANKGAHPTDERIAERVREVFVKERAVLPRLEQDVISLLCEMRDAIEEKDRYKM